MLTKRRQQQTIRDLMSALPVDLVADDLTDPYDFLFLEIQDCLTENRQPYEHLMKVGMVHEDLKPDIEAILSLDPGYKLKHKSLDQIGPDLPETTWLWKHWIPRGLLTLLAAWPGVGKTYLALDLARLIITGTKTPDDSEFIDLATRNVIYVDAEDFIQEIYKRSRAWGMDMTKFWPIQRPPRALLDYSLPEYQDDLIEKCYDLRPDMVIIDSLSSVNSRGENSIEDLREVMGFFAEIPKAFNCSLVLIHHLRKPGKGQAQPLSMHDLRGSGHLVAMARSIIGMDLLRLNSSDDPNGARMLKVLKTNLGKYPFPLSVEFNDCPADPDIAQLNYSHIDLFNPVSKQTQAEKCAEWLIDLLSSGPAAFNDIVKLAETEGFSRYAITQARETLGELIVDTIGSKLTGNQWSLADDNVDASEVISSRATKADQCADWLKSLLEEWGEIAFSEIVDLGSEHDFTANTILRARQTLVPHIVDTVGPQRRGNKWKLAEWHQETDI